MLSNTKLSPVMRELPQDVTGIFMIPWFKNVEPHKDIKDGVLDEAVFAANLSEVSEGKGGRNVYTNAEMFFSKTFFTAGLKTICKRVIDGLGGKTDSGDRIISLQTGFGGGKTHSLISLFHIAKNSQNYKIVKESAKQLGLNFNEEE